MLGIFPGSSAAHSVKAGQNLGTNAGALGVWRFPLVSPVVTRRLRKEKSTTRLEQYLLWKCWTFQKGQECKNE